MVSCPTIPPSMASASMIIPAQVPNAGSPPRIASRSGSNSSKVRASFTSWSTPAGQHDAVEAVELARASHAVVARRRPRACGGAPARRPGGRGRRWWGGALNRGRPITRCTTRRLAGAMDLAGAHVAGKPRGDEQCSLVRLRRRRRSSWPSAPAGWRCRWPRPASASTGSRSRRRWWTGFAPSPAGRPRRHARRLRRRPVDGALPAGLPGVQHALQPAHPGRPGPLLRERRRAPDDDGVFLVEAFVPTWLHRLRDDQYVDAERIEADRVTLDVGRHDPVAQSSTSPT